MPFHRILRIFAFLILGLGCINTSFAEEKDISFEADNVVSRSEDASGEDHVDRLAHADFVLHLQDGALGVTQGVRQAVFEETFGQTNGHRQQVLKAFALLG